MLIVASNSLWILRPFRQSAIRTPHYWARIWDLRHNFTAYDAAYIALAEATGAVLYTRDRKLSKGHGARVILLEQ